MQTQEVAIKPNLKVVLKPDTEVLDEVVVTGYGTFKKSSFTGSASNVTTEKLQDLPSISVQDRLAGSCRCSNHFYFRSARLRCLRAYSRYGVYQCQQ